MKNPVYVIVPNWNGKSSLGTCLDSLLNQSIPAEIVVVDNGSIDGSSAYIKETYPEIFVIEEPVNRGFAGGVNIGIRHAIQQGAEFVALFNNDAVADKDWLGNLTKHLKASPKTGIVACQLLATDGSIDSIGECYTNWGLPYPQGRGELPNVSPDKPTGIFAASGGASLYRTDMLKEIGLFDEDFFAYYEDVDVSFRAQLAGWIVSYIPTAIAYHQIGATSSKIKGFSTYQMMKNQPLLLYKNVPDAYLFSVSWRLFIAQCLFFFRSLSRGNGLIALQGSIKSIRLLFKKSAERKRIQTLKKVSDDYIWAIITHDLPPEAHSLRLWRSRWWRLIGKKEA